MKETKVKFVMPQEKIIIKNISASISEDNINILRKINEKYTTVKKEFTQKSEKIQDRTNQLIIDWMDFSPKTKQ